MFKIPRLFVMMFMQYFVQGAWNMTIGAVLATYNMKESIGTTYSLLGLATIISPLFIGMIADRFFASQKVISILHILNGLVMLLLPTYILEGNVTALFSLLVCYTIQPQHSPIALPFTIFQNKNCSHISEYSAISVLL